MASDFLACPWRGCVISPKVFWRFRACRSYGDSMLGVGGAEVPHVFVGAGFVRVGRGLIFASLIQDGAVGIPGPLPALPCSLG